MRDLRLLLIDGLPGTGKSTMSVWLAAELGRRGIVVRILRERQTDHPLNVGGDRHPSGDVPGEAMFAQYDAAGFIHESLDRWRRFVDRTACTTDSFVLDSYPFQNSVRVLVQMDAGTREIRQYHASVMRIASVLKPSLIYLDVPDTGEHLRGIASIRGPEWTDYAVALITRCPFAKARGMFGLEGAIAFCQEYKRLMDELVRQFPYPGLVLADCRIGWTDCCERIQRFLEID